MAVRRHPELGDKLFSSSLRNFVGFGLGLGGWLRSLSLGEEIGASGLPQALAGLTRALRHFTGLAALDSRRGTRNPARVQHVLQLPRTERTANSKFKTRSSNRLVSRSFASLAASVSARKKIEVLLRQQDPHFLPTACMSVQLAYEPVPTRPLRPTWP